MSTENDDWLDRVLAETNNVHIDDDGFTDAVMIQLPARKRRNRWLNAAILAGAASLSGAVLLGTLPDQAVVYRQISELLLTRPIVGLALFSLTMSTIAGLITGWMLGIER